jgi:hypothetical protein
MKFGHKIYAATQAHELAPCFFGYKAIKKKIKKLRLLGPGAERNEQLITLLDAISIEVRGEGLGGRATRPRPSATLCLRSIPQSQCLRLGHSVSRWARPRMPCVLTPVAVVRSGVQGERDE